MNIVYDEKMRKSNLVKHGFDFVDAAIVFAGITYTVEDRRFDYGEQRFVILGLLQDKVVVIVHTEAGDEIRIISMRKALKHEEVIYFKNI